MIKLSSLHNYFANAFTLYGGGGNSGGGVFSERGYLIGIIIATEAINVNFFIPATLLSVSAFIWYNPNNKTQLFMLFVITI